MDPLAHGRVRAYVHGTSSDVEKTIETSGADTYLHLGKPTKTIGWRGREIRTASRGKTATSPGRRGRIRPNVSPRSGAEANRERLPVRRPVALPIGTTGFGVFFWCPATDVPRGRTDTHRHTKESNGVETAVRLICAVASGTRAVSRRTTAFR